MKIRLKTAIVSVSIRIYAKRADVELLMKHVTSIARYFRTVDGRENKSIGE